MKHRPKKKLISRPFVHDNLEFKKSLLKYAQELRNKPKDDFESKLISAVLYAQLAEYMARFLLESLRSLTYEIIYNFTQAYVFVDARDKSSLSLERLIEGLNDFSFPDKPEIIKLFNEIKEARNDLFHNLPSKTQEDLIEIGEDITVIQDRTETVINKLDVIINGMQNRFYPPIVNTQPNTSNTQ